jgi:hypothetical protein
VLFYFSLECAAVFALVSLLASRQAALASPATAQHCWDSGALGAVGVLLVVESCLRGTGGGRRADDVRRPHDTVGRLAGGGNDGLAAGEREDPKRNAVVSDGRVGRGWGGDSCDGMPAVISGA